MNLILQDDVILRDEHHYLDSDSRFFYNARSRHTEFLSRAAFELLTALTVSTPVEQAWREYIKLATRYHEEIDRTEFEQFVSDFLKRGTLRQAASGESSTRPLANLSLTAPNAKYQPRTFPTKVNITSTLLCNLECKHCLRESSPRIDTSNEWLTDELLQLFEDLDKYGAIEVAFSGGETTTRRDLMTLLKSLQNSRFFFEYFTNGHVLNEAIYEELVHLKDHKQKGLQIHISLDGVERDHEWMRGKGTFARVLHTMERFGNDGFIVVVESVLSPSACSRDNVSSIINLCRERGVKGIGFHPASLSGRAFNSSHSFLFSYEQLREFEAIVNDLAGMYADVKVEYNQYFYPGIRKNEHEFDLPKNVGPQGMFLVGIGSDGSVYPCTEAIGDLEQVIGNVRETGILDIWHSDKWAFYRGGWEIDQLPACKGCMFNGNCQMQACRCYAKRVRGDCYDAMPECYALGEYLWEK